MAYQLSNYKDIDSSVAPLVLQYYKYMDQEDYAGASSLLEENHELLKPYIIDMDSINKIEQGLADCILNAISRHYRRSDRTGR